MNLMLAQDRPYFVCLTTFSGQNSFLNVNDEELKVDVAVLSISSNFHYKNPWSPPASIERIEMANAHLSMKTRRVWVLSSLVRLASHVHTRSVLAGTTRELPFCLTLRELSSTHTLRGCDTPALDVSKSA